MTAEIPWYKRLKQERTKRNQSQADLAKELGVGPKTIQRWETGINEPQPHWRTKLCEHFHISAEAFGFLPTHEKEHLKRKRSTPPPKSTHASQRYIVGRQTEVQLFDDLLAGRTDYWLLNIYGPGGIGKSVVCQKLQAYAQTLDTAVATIDGYYPDLTPDYILSNFKQSFMDGPFGDHLEDTFHDFDSQLRDYHMANHLIVHGGGLHALFDTIGNVRDPTTFTSILAGLKETPPEALQQTMHNRFALDRYLRGAERSLTSCFINALAAIGEKLNGPIAMLMDTYEEIEAKGFLDNWICRTLVPSLPPGVRLVILGRNQLLNINFDWRDFDHVLHTQPLPELSEEEAKAYLSYYGLTDPVALQRIYEFIGGYPLLLVLARQLADVAGGWEKIGTLEQGRDRDFIATQLLERILREESVQEVRAFLEKGAVAPWFDPETISVILDINVDQAKTIYDKLQRHSFVERHPFGARLHDKIREILDAKLKFTSITEYEHLKDKLRNHYAKKAGIKTTI